jgi:hypothetical protein
MGTRCFVLCRCRATGSRSGSNQPRGSGPHPQNGCGPSFCPLSSGRLVYLAGVFGGDVSYWDRDINTVRDRASNE